MKRFFLIINLFTATNLLTYSQLTKGDFLVYFTGSYNESINSSGVTISNYSGKTKSLDLGFSFGYSISNSIIVGLGIEYGHIKDSRDYTFYYYHAFALGEEMKIKNAIISPMIFLTYYKNVVTKLWFNLNLTTSYGFVDSKYESSYIGVSQFPTNGQPDVFPRFSSGSNAGNKSKYLVVALQPEFNYFLTQKIGLILKMGGIRYNSYDFKDDEWKININPSNWEYGLFLRFGKKINTPANN